MGAGGLNVRVRHGTGCGPSAVTTRDLKSILSHNNTEMREEIQGKMRIRPRRISTGQLKASQLVHFRPINPVIFRTPYFPIGMGYLILEAASRLDAFSGYPTRT